MDRNGDEDSRNISALKEQIAAYLNVFSSVVELGRSKWTEFNLNLMSTGFGILVISLLLQLLAVFHGDKSYAVGSWLSTGAAFTLFIVTIRACSFLSNSYISAVLCYEKDNVERSQSYAVIFLVVVFVLRVSIDIGLTKQAATSQFMSSLPSWMLGIAPDHPALTYAIEIAPVLSVVILICVLYIAVTKTPNGGLWKYTTVASMISYFLIALLWASEGKMFGLDGLLQVTGGRNRISQTV